MNHNHTGLDCVSAGAVRKRETTRSANQSAERKDLAGDQSAEQVRLLQFILRGIDRGKINDASVVPPAGPNDTEADLTTLSAMIRNVLAKAEARDR